MTKKQIKQKKKNIIENSASFVGFSYNVLNKIPIYALTDALNNIIHFGYKAKNEHDMINIVVTESVKAMSYSDFKEIKNYFF